MSYYVKYPEPIRIEEMLDVDTAIDLVNEINEQYENVIAMISRDEIHTMIKTLRGNLVGKIGEDDDCHCIVFGNDNNPHFIRRDEWLLKYRPSNTIDFPDA